VRPPKTLSCYHAANDDEGTAVNSRCLHLLCDVSKRSEKDLLVRPGGMVHYGYGRVCGPVQGVDYLSYPVYAQENCESCAVPAKRRQLILSRVVPAGLVMINDSDTPFSVSCVLRAAEAANRDETPGTTSTSTPASSRGFICSTMAP